MSKILTTKSKILTTNKNHPCPICNDTSGDCRQTDNNVILCHSFIDKHQDPNHPEWEYRGIAKNPIWGMFAPRREKENFDRDYWLERSRQVKAKREQAKVSHRKNSLSVLERDQEIRKILAQLTLSESDRHYLENRSGPIPESVILHCRSVIKFQPLTDLVNIRLPGVNRYGNALNNGWQGILVPFMNEDGLFVGMRLHDPKAKEIGNPKYVWLSSAKRGYSPKLPNGEFPIAVYWPDVITDPTRIGLCEGLEWKAAIAAQRLGYPVIGFSGFNFHQSPKTLLEVIEKIRAKLQQHQSSPNQEIGIAIITDAGTPINKTIANSHKETIQWLESLKNKVSVAWWGQVYKVIGDIDEIDLKTSINYLTSDEFSKIIWIEQTRQSWRKSKDFTASIQLNQKHLNYKDFQDNIIYFIKAGLGSGKSTNNRKWINENREWLEYQRVFYLGYRNNLLLQECSKVSGLLHIQNIQEDKILLADPTLWVALCLDSLIKFQPDDFNNAVIILDEIVSIIKHLLFSNTEIKKYRDRVIHLFSEAIKRARMVICLDGNLADWIVKFMGSLAPDKEIVTIENIYQSERPELIWIDGSYKREPEDYFKNNYKGLVSKILELSVGHKAICSDSQATLETIDSLLKAMGKKTLRVDSKTSGTKEVKAFLADPEKWLRENLIDFLLYSPTAESGLDVSITNYFNAHYCLFFGVLDVDSTLQMIARIRDILCAKFFWAREYSINQDDFQSPDPGILSRCLNERLSLDLNRVLSGESNGAEIKAKILETYQQAPDMYVEAALFVNAQRNFERSNYRQCLLERLEATGYKTITETTLYDRLSGKCDSYKDTKKEIQINDSEKIFNAEIKPDKQLNPEKLEDQYSQRKAQILKSLPGIQNDPIWSPDFILKILHNDRQLISQARRYWLLTRLSVNQRLEQEKFKKVYDRFFDDHYSMIWLDRNENGKIWALSQSGISAILNHPDPQKLWSEEDSQIQFIIQNCRKRKTLRLHLGNVGKIHPMQYVGRLLKMIGAKWKKTEIEGEYRLNLSRFNSLEWAAITDALTRKWAKYLSTDLTPIVWEPPVSYYEKISENSLEKYHKYNELLKQSGQAFETYEADHVFSVGECPPQLSLICTENLTKNRDSTMTDENLMVNFKENSEDKVIFHSFLNGPVLTQKEGKPFTRTTLQSTNSEVLPQVKSINHFEVGDHVLCSRYPSETFKVIETYGSQAHLENAWGCEWVLMSELSLMEVLRYGEVAPKNWTVV